MDLISYPLGYKRQASRSVDVGGVLLGCGFPVRIQSMLSSATHDINGCFKEIQALDRAGCEIIRLTVPSRRDLDAVPEIRRLMTEDGISRPLVADVHFSPQLAVDACEVFEKVRINPGNFSDRPKSSGSKVKLSFEEGYEKLREAVVPLVSSLKKNRRALRIGVNQGSLSIRMMERYGDSPLGMVMSALEMIELFEDSGFDQLVVSLKSSNPIVVQRAYRLLAEKQAGKNPVALHLGVTEAGNDLMGRMKSLVGIGVLLADGIGDTIRVSLTEPGPNEIQFARQLVTAIEECKEKSESRSGEWKRPVNHEQSSGRMFSFGKHYEGKVLQIGELEKNELPDCGFQFEADFQYYTRNGRVFLDDKSGPLPVIDRRTQDNYRIPEDAAGVLLLSEIPLYDLRRMNSEEGLKNSKPVVGMTIRDGSQDPDLFWEIQLAGALSEGLLDFLLLPGNISDSALARFLMLLQATRVRLVTTDYIVCPSCGRTLFDIKRATEEIKRYTNHLAGLKIGVMGCIVNGPGEMADADFGYVGSGKGTVDLYYGQKRVRRGIAESEAVVQLIDLIREKGRWREPPEDE